MGDCSGGSFWRGAVIIIFFEMGWMREGGGLWSVIFLGGGVAVFFLVAGEGS